MDYSIVIFLVVIVYFAYRGYKSGLLPIASKLISLPAGYIVAYFFTVDFVPIIRSVFSVAGVMAYITAGSILFTVTVALFSLIFWLMQRMWVEQNQTTTQISAISGALLGAIVGVLLGIFIVWFVSTTKTLIQSKRGITPSAPTPFEQNINQITAGAISEITHAATKDADLSQATAVLLTSPAENIERIQQISQRQLLPKLLRNYDAKIAMDDRDPGALMHNPAFQKLVNDRDFKALAIAMELPSDPQAMQKDVAIKMTKIWTQIHQVQYDPEFIAITQDPEFQQMMQSKNIYRMMNSSKVEELIKILANAPVPEITFVEKQPQQPPPEKKPTEIYRWVDEKGRVHYSDQKPEENDK